jgi:hypothetical protein
MSTLNADESGHLIPVESISATPIVPEDAPPASEPPLRKMPWELFLHGALFGAFVGLFIGALSGAAFCWMVDDNDHLWVGAAIGVVAGLVGGMLTGGIERWRRGDFVRPDLATMIGGIFGLAVAIVAFVNGMASVRGNLTMFGLVGMAMVFPTAGILIGGLFDRSFEAAQNSKRRDAAVYCVFALSASLGLFWLMLTYPTGTSAEDLVRPLSGLIYTEIREEPEMRKAVVKNIVLVRNGNRDYAGTFEIVVEGRTTRYRVEAQLNDEILSATWHPRSD